RPRAPDRNGPTCFSAPPSRRCAGATAANRGTASTGSRRRHRRMRSRRARRRTATHRSISTAAMNKTGMGPVVHSSCRDRPAPRSGRSVTPPSFALGTPGASPWISGPASSAYQVPLSAAEQAPLGPAVPFPSLALRSLPPPFESEFTPDWRSVRAGLERINLNRPLPPFPHQGSGSSPPFGATLCGPGERFDSAQAASQFHDALFERQRLADNIYRRLLLLTGVPPAANPAVPSDQELLPRRWLAQLAANMVDFIDEDEISTPFNFYTEQDAYPHGRPPAMPPF